MFLFSFFFLFSSSVTSVDVRSIINGVWFVNESKPLQEKRNIRTFKANISFIGSTNSSQIVFTNDRNITVKRLLLNWFNFYSFELKEGTKTLATFDFQPNLPPQVSSTGQWCEDQIYNAVLISKETFSIQIMDPVNSTWKYYTFVRDFDAWDNDPTTWKDKAFAFAFYGITIGLVLLVINCMQKYINKKNLKEAYRILEKEEKEVKAKKD